MSCQKFWQYYFSIVHYLPWEEGATVTLVFSSATGLSVSFPIRLDCVFLGALVTLPLLLAVLPAEVLLDAGEVSECPRRIVVDAGLLRADVHLLLYFLVRPLPQLPWKVVTPPVKLKVLIPLEPFVAYLTYESVGGHEGLGRKSNNLSIWICNNSPKIQNKTYLKKQQSKMDRHIEVWEPKNEKVKKKSVL